MPKAKSKEIAKPEPKEVQTYQNIPGLEGVEQDMLIIPRLKLVQQMSEEVNDYDMKPGTMCNSVSKDAVGKAPTTNKDGMAINIIPIFIASRSRILFKDMKEGGGILCQSRDGKTGNGDPGGNCSKCSEKEFTVDDTGNNIAPKCSDFINIFCLIEGYDSVIPLVINFGKTNMGTGKQLVNFLIQKQKSPWLFKFELKTLFVNSEKGDHFVFKIKPAGIPNDDQKAEAEALYRMLIKTQYQIDQDDMEEKTTQFEGKVEPGDPDAF